MAFNTVSALLAAGAEDISNLFVVIMGLGVVFIGLLSIVILTTIMSAVIRAMEGKKKVEAPAAAPAAVAAAPIANRGELVAAIAACVAEELGTDVSGIRIVSIKNV